MKKTIQELKIKDTVWMVQQNNSKVEPCTVYSISTKELSFSGNVYKMDSSDLTRWFFEYHHYGKYNVYINKIDALKYSREMLDLEMDNAFKAQESFLDRIRAINSKVMENNILIAEELKK